MGHLSSFKSKEDGSLRLCVDIRAIKKVTVKKKDPVPLVADLFDPLGKATSFTKLDLRSGYYQVRIAAGDEPKTNILPDMVRLSIAPPDQCSCHLKTVPTPVRKGNS